MEADMRISFTDVFRSTATWENPDPTTRRKRLLRCRYALGTSTGYQRMGHKVSAEMLHHICRRYVTRENPCQIRYLLAISRINEIDAHS